MYTERDSLEDEIQFNRREIQSLRDRNMDLIKRLREIDERDMNDEISYDATKSVMNSLTEVVGKLSDLIPEVPVTKVIEHMASAADPEQIIKEEPKPTPVQAALKEEQKKEVATKKEAPGKISRERVASIIKEILIENKEPVHFKDIEKEFYNRTGKKYVNFYEQIKFSSAIYPKLKKVSRGLYTYETTEKQMDESKQAVKILHTV